MQITQQTKLRVTPVALVVSNVSSQSSSSWECVEPCCSTSSTQPKCMGSTRRTCRDKTWRDEPSGSWALST